MDHDADIRKARLAFRLVNWIGIIEQLARTKGNRILAEIGLPWPQFILLNHFSHRPKDGKTVTDVARAMQQQQPGVTKTLKAMVSAGLLRVEKDAADGRIRYHYLTETGIMTHRAAIAALGPALNEAFEEWSLEEMEQTFTALDRLKVYFDTNR